eukprot:gene4334-14447_t
MNSRSMIIAVSLLFSAVALLPMGESAKPKTTIGGAWVESFKNTTYNVFCSESMDGLAFTCMVSIASGPKSMEVMNGTRPAVDSNNIISGMRLSKTPLVYAYSWYSFWQKGNFTFESPDHQLALKACPH